MDGPAINRRDFLKVGGATAVTVGAGSRVFHALAPQSTAPAAGSRSR